MWWISDHSGLFWSLLVLYLVGWNSLCIWKDDKLTWPTEERRETENICWGNLFYLKLRAECNLDGGPSQIFPHFWQIFFISTFLTKILYFFNSDKNIIFLHFWQKILYFYISDKILKDKDFAESHVRAPTLFQNWILSQAWDGILRLHQSFSCVMHPNNRNFKAFSFKSGTYQYECKFFKSFLFTVYKILLT